MEMTVISRKVLTVLPVGWWLLPWVSPLVRQRRGSERWALPLKRAPPVCLSQTHLHKKSSERHLPFCHHFKRWSGSSANAAIISKGESLKASSDVFSPLRPRECHRTLFFPLSTEILTFLWHPSTCCFRSIPALFYILQMLQTNMRWCISVD